MSSALIKLLFKGRTGPGIGQEVAGARLPDAAVQPCALLPYAHRLTNAGFQPVCPPVMLAAQRVDRVCVALVRRPHTKTARMA
jgi:hypothetical protein